MIDPIERQAALDCFHDWIDKRGDIHTPDEMAEYRAIDALPSAQPLTAYVIKDEYGNIKCSNCGSPNCWGNYCMNCGAKMGRRQDEQENNIS